MEILLNNNINNAANVNIFVFEIYPKKRYLANLSGCNWTMPGLNKPQKAKGAHHNCQRQKVQRRSGTTSFLTPIKLDQIWTEDLQCTLRSLFLLFWTAVLFYTCNHIFTARKRSLREGNVFTFSVCSQGGGGQGGWGTYPTMHCGIGTTPRPVPYPTSCPIPTPVPPLFPPFPPYPNNNNSRKILVATVGIEPRPLAQESETILTELADHLLRVWKFWILIRHALLNLILAEPINSKCQLMHQQ